MRAATPSDAAAVHMLLKSAGLPTEGVAPLLAGQGGSMVLMEAPDAVLGCAAVETHGSRGLLRSVAVREDLRGRGVGEAMVLDRIQQSRTLGLETLHLLTMSAAPFFSRYGFQSVERTSAPDEIRGTWEFSVHCSDAATLMALSLASPVVFVLVRTQFAGNLGMVCRAAMSFAFADVRLVCPVFDLGNPEGLWFAHGAEEALDRVGVFDSLNDAVADCFRTIGTTARRRHSNRPLHEPAEVAEDFRSASAEQKIALVFGPEDDGLSNEELARCDSVVSIPRGRATGATLSLPAAATILAWEVAKARGLELPQPLGRPAAAERAKRALSSSELDGLVDLVAVSFEEIGLRPLPDGVRFRGSIRDFLARAEPTDADRLFLRHLFAQLEKWKRRVAGEARRGVAGMLGRREG